MILSAVYMLWMFQRVNYGPVTKAENASLPDLKAHEWAAILPIVVLVVLMGIVPNLFLRPIEPSVDRTLDRIRRGAPAEIRAGSLAPVAR
jgi:NADH-quinone oxidoreductase subunit M